jgi:hypothetical protein
MLVVALVFSIAVPDGEWQRCFAMLLQGLAIFATLAAAEADRRILRAFLVILVVAFAGAVLQAGISDGHDATYVRLSIFVVLLLSLPLVGFGLLRQVRVDRKITVQTMMGVLCAYLLLVSCFAYAYAVIGVLASEPFFSQGAKWGTIGDYIYFSVITITTVGFGDLSPGTDLGRSVTAAEALIGQIYMVTVVAVIVSNLGRSEPRPAGSEEEPTGGVKSDGGSPGG